LSGSLGPPARRGAGGGAGGGGVRFLKLGTYSGGRRKFRWSPTTSRTDTDSNYRKNELNNNIK